MRSDHTRTRQTIARLSCRDECKYWKLLLTLKNRSENIRCRLTLVLFNDLLIDKAGVVVVACELSQITSSSCYLDLLAIIKCENCENCHHVKGNK
jgi:hypothetical protein